MRRQGLISGYPGTPHYRQAPLKAHPAGHPIRPATRSARPSMSVGGGLCVLYGVFGGGPGRQQP